MMIMLDDNFGEDDLLMIIN